MRFFHLIADYMGHLCWREEMVVADVFVVRYATEQSRRLTIEALRQRLDKDAPYPRLVMGPVGEPLYVFVVDFHRSPRAVCEQLGFKYAHLGFVDVLSDSYTAVNQTIISGNLWARIFLILWN